MGEGTARILVVDDDDLVRDVLRAVLEQAGHEVVTAPDAAGALRLVAAAPVAVALVDLGLGVDSGHELCRKLRALPTPPSVILMSGAEAPDLIALDAGGFLQKPCRTRDLLACVAAVLGRRSG